MPQTRLHFTVPKAGSDQLFTSLEAAFEEDAFPLASFDLEAEGRVELSLYAEGEIDPVERRLRDLIQDPQVTIAREELPEVDWVSRSLEGLKPVRAGRFLVHGAHDRSRRRAGDIAIEIEAGLAFGTGHHGTTAGCLEMLHGVLRRSRPRNALDLGTGSGVLAIALARLAHVPVLATDIDPVAVEVAAQNVRLNRVGSHVRAAQAAGFHHRLFSRNGPFDLIVANILARPLMKLAPQMARHLAPGGAVILSGILDRQRNAVLAAYVGQRFRHVATLHREGWSTLHLQR